jgi:hypothetical protein
MPVLHQEGLCTNLPRWCARLAACGQYGLPNFPLGALSATRGNKYVSKNGHACNSFIMLRVLVTRVEKLQGLVKNMSSRIRNLEAALANASLAINQFHPLLAQGVKWEEQDDIGLPPEPDTNTISRTPYDEAEEELNGQLPEVR